MIASWALASEFGALREIQKFRVIRTLARKSLTLGTFDHHAGHRNTCIGAISAGLAANTSRKSLRIRFSHF